MRSVLFSIPTPVLMSKNQVNLLLLSSGGPALGSLFHPHGISSVLVATSLSSCWHHVNGHSSLFVISSVTVSPVLKDFITVISFFIKERVIHSQNALVFLLPYLLVLLVLFNGILNCCRLCASTQSSIFCHQSFISKNVISRDFFPLLQIKESCFVFRVPERPA